KPTFGWDIVANWTSAGQVVTGLPRGIPESYVSDTWLYGNVRNGTMVGLSTMSLTGFFYLRNNQGDLLIDPTTGLPVRSNVLPSANPAYYTSMSEELFIERDINWLRLRDVQLSYELPQGFLGSRNASVFVKGTDLLLITNYTGLDPIVNGNTAAVGGSGGVGI